MVGGRADITVPGSILAPWRPPTYVFGESVRNIQLRIDLTPVVPGLAELRQQVGSFYQDLAEQNRDAYLEENSVNAAIDAQNEQDRIDAVRRRLPLCA